MNEVLNISDIMKEPGAEAYYTNILTATPQNSVERKIKVKKYKCNVCGLLCAAPSVLEIHMRTHTGEKPYKCNICNYRCSMPGSVKAHMRVHTGERPFACSMCQYRCAHSTSLRVHERTHTGFKPYRCSLCDFSCTTNSSIKSHMVKHTKEKKFACNTCEFRTATLNHLKAHMRNHATDKPYRCRYCDYSTTKPSVLSVHERLHTGEKPFPCKSCDKQFISLNYLKDHFAKVHDCNKSAFPCFLCEEDIETAEQWMTHLISHGKGELLLKCHKCEYETHRTTNLNIHVMSKHTEELPWPCMFCQNRFSRKTNLRRHIQQNHRLQVSSVEGVHKTCKARGNSEKKVLTPPKQRGSKPLTIKLTADDKWDDYSSHSDDVNESQKEIRRATERGHGNILEAYNKVNSSIPRQFSSSGPNVDVLDDSMAIIDGFEGENIIIGTIDEVESTIW